jgi:hypothetical protein
VYCAQCSIENRDRTQVSNRIFFDRLITLLVVNVVMFSIACNLGGGGNMVACLIVNLVTNSITKLEDWAEYTFSPLLKLQIL